MSCTADLKNPALSLSSFFCFNGTLPNANAIFASEIESKFMGINKSKLRRGKKAKVLELPPIAPKRSIWDQVVRVIIFLFPVLLACYFVWDLSNEK